MNNYRIRFVSNSFYKVFFFFFKNCNSYSLQTYHWDFVSQAENDSSYTATISLRRDEPGHSGVMLKARDTVRRSGQPFNGNSNGHFVPCTDNDSDDYR